jgi:hypothetical protein
MRMLRRKIGLASYDGLTGSYSGLAGLLHIESDSFFENSKAIRLYVIR